MATRDRDTYVFRHGVTPETMSVISSKNKIYAVPADGTDKQLLQIGVTSTFNPSESRTIERVRGIGFGDHVAELVPGQTEPMTIAVTRTAQYLSMLFQVFGYMGGLDGIVRSLRHHKWPFDIRQEIVTSLLPQVTTAAAAAGGAGVQNKTSDDFDSDQAFAIITLYEGCWFADYNTTYAADTALIQENCTINVTDIISDTDAAYSEGSLLLFNNKAQSQILTPNSGLSTM